MQKVLDKWGHFYAEIERLRAENERLRAENERLHAVKRRALLVADERAKENERLRAALAKYGEHKSDI